MLCNFDSKLQSLFLDTQRYASLVGARELDSALLLFVAQKNFLSEEVSLSFPEGDPISSPVFSQETQGQIARSLRNASSSTVTMEDFLLEILSHAGEYDLRLAGLGDEERDVLLRKFSQEKEKKAVKRLLGSGDSILERKGRDLTALVREGEITMPSGRDKEFSYILQILSRRKKSNPLLVGEPGTGKTAIAEGLACLIVQKKVPEDLLNARVVEIAASAFTDAQRRGKGEEFVRRVAKEIALDQKKGIQTIIFVDELHAILLGGGAVSQFMKPVLVSEGFRMIGATTVKEYRQYIEKDEALSRRFLPVTIKEFSPEAAIDVVSHEASSYETFHGVTLPKDVVKGVVHLSHRYIADRKLPDKAFDLLDLACVEAQKGAVTMDHVRKIAAQRANIPLDLISSSLGEVCKKLQPFLAQKILGQPQAIKKIADKLYARFLVPNRRARGPLASFLFVGPTGTGKTEMAKALAELFFGSEENLLRLDMSEYQESFSINRLIGADPGYTGSEAGGILTEKVHKNPFSLILVDEFEKADVNVQQLFLQIIDEGRLSDASGTLFDFKNTMIICTSNAVVKSKRTPVGFNAQQDCFEKEGNSSLLKKELAQTFPQELLGRFDECIFFQKLSADAIKELFLMRLREEEEALRTDGITLNVDDDVVDFLVSSVLASPSGGREVHHLFESHIMSSLARHLGKKDYTTFSVSLSSQEPKSILVEPAVLVSDLAVPSTVCPDK